ncbi:MAG: CRTAC1 family protein [Myxococcota bacterium]|nr:CRTAC1 family protein [Myxococcota bacterium]
MSDPRPWPRALFGLLAGLLGACGPAAPPPPPATGDAGAPGSLASTAPTMLLQGRARLAADEPAGAPPRVGLPELPALQPAGEAPADWIALVDVAAELGVRFTRRSGGSGRKHYCEPKGGGVAFLDVDGDGWQDVYLVDGGPLPGSADFARANRLFRNRQGRGFDDVTGAAGVAGGWYDMGVATGDYDGDGDVDLFVTGVDGTLLYRNRGDGTFEDVTEQAGVRLGGWCSAALFVDVDEDGYLDLYVVRYVDYHPRHNAPCYSTGVHNYCTPHDFPPLADHLLRNRRGQGFEDITGSAFVVPPVAPGLMAIAADFDEDGHQDIYVANDESPNFLFMGDGNGKFKENGLFSGVAVGATGFPGAGMGVDVGDVDGNTLLDIVVGNFTDQPVDYYRNLGRGIFSEESSRAGIFGPTYHPLEFAVRLLDLDNDTDLDLFVCHGHIWDTVASFQPGVEFPQANSLLRNRGDGTFEDLSRRSGPGLLLRRVSRGAAAADFDRDGDLDLIYSNQDSPAVLLRNDGGNRRSWLQLQLVGRPPNTAASGARVEVTVGGRTLVRQVTTAGGYQSGNEPLVHLGLGDASQVERIVVRWPPPARGTTELGPTPARQRLTIQQP